MRNKRYLKFRIYSFEVNSAKIISHGLVSGKGKLPIMRHLKRELLNFRSTVKMTDSEANELWLFCSYSYNKISKDVWGKRTDNESVYMAIRRLFGDMEGFKNRLGTDIELHEKDVYLDRLLSDGIFYLCSAHKDCAKDHLDFQGKIYVSEDWEARCLDGDQARIRAYIKNHKIQTIEWVVGDPVYMTTRPNCRHYFIKMDVEEVLSNSVNKMLKQHHMIRERVNLTYEYVNYRKYYERLKLLKSLRDTCPCSQLEADIKETRRMMKKWLSLIE